MKKLFAFLAMLIFILGTFAETSVAATTWVRGYTRKDGTYVPPHSKSKANSSKSDNYSTKGNVNPYTGKKGTTDPYAPKKRYKW